MSVTMVARIANGSGRHHKYSMLLVMHLSHPSPPWTSLSPSPLQGMITDILEENVVQPLLVSTSAIKLAAETVRSILKIDDIVSKSEWSDLDLTFAHF